MESENKTANTYAKGLPERPDHIMRLPVDGRGYPVPYFASYFDGKPDFRVIDRDKVIATAAGDFAINKPRSIDSMRSQYGE